MRKLFVLLLFAALFLEGSTCVPTTPAFECAGTVTSSTTTGTLSCVQTGDFLIAASCGALGSGTQTITCPTGFTAAGALSGNGDANHMGQQVCYKVATSGDTSSSTYTFTYNGTGIGSGATSAIMDFRGGSTTLDQTAINFHNSQYQYALGVTTTLRSDMVVYMYCYGITGNPRTFADVPPGSTLTAYTSASTFPQGMYAAYLSQPLPGTTATEFVTTTCGCSNGQNTVAFGGAP